MLKAAKTNVLKPMMLTVRVKFLIHLLGDKNENHTSVQSLVWVNYVRRECGVGHPPHLFVSVCVCVCIALH